MTEPSLIPAIVRVMCAPGVAPESAYTVDFLPNVWVFTWVEAMLLHPVFLNSFPEKTAVFFQFLKKCFSIFYSWLVVLKMWTLSIKKWSGSASYGQ